MSVDISAVDEVLSTTRAVRRRLDLHASRRTGSHSSSACGLAIQAPTASNGQNWRWMVVDRSRQARRYRRYLPRVRRGVPCARRPHDVGPADQDRSTRARTRSAQTLARVPVHVIPCIESRFDGKPVGRRGVGMGVDHPGGLELHAGAAGARPRVGVDDAAPGPRPTRSLNCLASRTMSRRLRCCRWPTRSDTDFKPASAASGRDRHLAWIHLGYALSAVARLGHLRIRVYRPPGEADVRTRWVTWSP